MRSQFECVESPDYRADADEPRESSLLEQVIVGQTALLAEIVQKLQVLQEDVQRQAQQQDEAHRMLRHSTHCIHSVQRLFDPFRLRQRFASRLFHLHQYTPQVLKIPPRYARTKPPTQPPLISLVTPSFNQAEFLVRTIRSVLQQDYPRLEYIVQDGGSKDGSVGVLREHAAQLTHWESAPDGGQAHAINLGFARTSGSLMGWLNSDDMLLPGALAYVANYFAQHPKVDVVYGSRYIIDARDREIGSWLLPPHDDDLLRWVDYVPQETLFWRRDIWERSGGQMDESFDFALDWDLLLRFQAAGAKFACLPRFLGAFRVTENTKTSQKIATIGQDEVDRLRQRTLGFVPTPDEVHLRTKSYLRRHLWRRGLRRLGLLRY